MAEQEYVRVTCDVCGKSEEFERKDDIARPLLAWMRITHPGGASDYRDLCVGCATRVMAAIGAAS